MPATSIGEIGLDLVVNQGQFNKQMAGITGIAKKAGAALAGAFAVSKIVDFGKKCLELGSDLAEVQNVVDVTFPNMTAQVDKFAKSAAQSFGLSETMAKQYTGTFGAMAKAFGFSEKASYDMGTALTGLAGDVASFYNISQDEAYTKLKSVFTGETESLKDLGVVMTQTALDSYAMANGFGKTTSAMSEQEKVALRYKFVQDQLATSSGDFARTSGSWANQVRILKLQMQSFMATVGQGLINIFTPAIRVINILVGKLITLANAFKAFTELITGKKSSGATTQASSMASMGTAADDASSGLDNAADSADSATKSNDKVAQSAKKAAKELRSLMGFDKINKLNDNSSDNSSGNGTPSGTTGGVLGGTMDFGKLAEGDTAIDGVSKKMDALIKRCKQLAILFKKGFKIGFGNSEEKIKSITNSIRNIGKNLKEIFTDPGVVQAANKCMDSIALVLGKVAGSFVRVGLIIADNLIGGFDKYLEKSKGYIKKKLVSIFDITGDIAALSGDFAVAVTDVFDVFSGEAAKGITADIIGIFSDGFLGATEIALKFVRDMAELVVKPVTDNIENIKLAIENTLTPIKMVLDTLHQAVADTFEKISQTYDTYVKPFMGALAEGFSSILTTFMEGYNTYIAPVLDFLAAKVTAVWQEHIQPAINQTIEVLGKVFELLTTIWKSVLQPLIEWIIANIMPVIAPIIAILGNTLLDFAGIVADVIKGVMEILGGILDFLTGVFSGDWKKAWGGIQEIAKGFRDILGTIFKFIKENVMQPLINFLKNTFRTSWTNTFNTLKNVLSTFKNGVKDVWDGVKRVFNGIIEFVTGTFTGNWSRAWEGIKDIFGGIFDSLVSLAKTPINMIIDVVNGLLSSLNNGLSAIERAFTFNWGFTNPVTGTKHNWHFGMSLPRVPTIPPLAEGGFVKPNTPQLAMIGDNKHQGEVVAPEGKLKEMAMAAVKEAGSGVTKEDLETIVNRAVMRIIAALSDMGFYLDAEQVGRATRAAQAAADRRFNAVEVG